MEIIFAYFGCMAATALLALCRGASRQVARDIFRAGLKTPPLGVFIALFMALDGSWAAQPSAAKKPHRKHQHAAENERAAREKARREPVDRETAKEARKRLQERYYCAIFGIKGQIDQQTLKLRYRQLVKDYHPDKFAHLGAKQSELAEANMKDINEAYEYFRRFYGS